MFHRIPLRGAPRVMCHGNCQTGPIGEALQFAFPETHAATVAAATVSQDQQTLPRAVRASAVSPPPVADRIDGQLRGVFTSGNANMAAVATKVVDPIRNCAALG